MMLVDLLNALHRWLFVPRSKRRRTFWSVPANRLEALEASIEVTERGRSAAWKITGGGREIASGIAPTVYLATLDAEDALAEMQQGLGPPPAIAQAQAGDPRAITPPGWHWSEHMDGWVAPDGTFISYRHWFLAGGLHP